MTTAEFASINSQLTYAETVESLGDPVYGQADDTFYYSRYPMAGGQDVSTMIEGGTALFVATRM